MITIHLNTTQGLHVTNDEEDGVEDGGFTDRLTQAIADAAQKAYEEFMGIQEVRH